MRRHFYNNLNNTCPITVIFGTTSSQTMRHRKMVSFDFHLSNATALPWKSQNTKMTNLEVSNRCKVLFCE